MSSLVPAEPTSAVDDIDGDPELRLLEKEPELWVHTVDKQVRPALLG